MKTIYNENYKCIIPEIKNPDEVIAKKKFYQLK